MEQPVVVYVAQGEIEEQQVRSFLEAHDIPTWVHGEALRKTHAFMLDGLGQVEILVEAAHEAAARDLLAKVESGEFALDELPSDLE